MTSTLTGSKVLLMMVSFFGIVVAVNSFFIYEAVNTFRGEDAKGAYLQGLDYNTTLDARSAQAALGWRATIGAARDASGTVRIDVDVRERNGLPVAGLRVDGSLDHPSDAERDRDLAFGAAGEGSYRATATNVARGNWEVIVRAKAADGTPFEARRRIWLP